MRITAGEWTPYLSPDLPHYGIAGRIITQAFAVRGINVTFTFFPWKRAFQLAKNGDFDGTAVWFKNSEREKSFLYSDTVVMEKFVFFHLKSRPFTWQTLDDLRGKTLGGLLGFSYGKHMDRAVTSGVFILERTSTDEQNFKKLLVGRIQVYPQEINVGYQVLARKFPAGERARITHHATPFLEQATYLLLSKRYKRNHRLIPLFNAGMSTLIKQGRIKQYYDDARQIRHKSVP